MFGGVYLLNGISNPYGLFDYIFNFLLHFKKLHLFVSNLFAQPLYVLYSHNHNIDLQTSMNERTHFFIKIYISHTLFSMYLWCVRDEWRQGQTAILTPTSLLTIAAPLLHLGWGLFKRGSPRVTALNLLAGPSLWHSRPTYSTATGICLYSFITSTCFHFFFPLIYTGVSLIDGSVKGQNIT